MKTTVIGSQMPAPELDSLVERLSQRRLASREGREWCQIPELDEAQLLIVNFSLPQARVYVTGEDVAYCARAYSGCGPIVVLDRFADPKKPSWYGHADSYVLPKPDLVTRFQAMVADVESFKSSTSIAELLGLDPDTIDRIPRELEALLGGGLQDITIWDVYRKSLETSRDVSSLWPRIVASKLHRWLNQMILPMQDVFVDANHLLPRMPSLLEGDPNDFESWCPPTTKLAPYPQSHWFPEPVWLASEIETLDIPEMRNPLRIPQVPFVFCEDVGCFRKRSEAKQVATDIKGRFFMRWLTS